MAGRIWPQTVSVEGLDPMHIGRIVIATPRGPQPEVARNAPLRAPLLVAVVLALREHPKVPAVEQRLSAGCAAYAILLAAEALGYAGIWRTGDAAFDRAVMAELGLAPHEELVGFVYLGTRDGAGKSLPELAAANYVSSW